MEYRQLGKSGLRISELGLGPWLTFSKNLSIKSAREIVHLAYDNGINLFDNAERYAEGMAEYLMGEVLKSFRRESLVITTKLYWGGEGTNDIGLSRKHLLEGIKNSLRRLQIDYVDLLFCHRPDPFTPLEEIISTMDMIIRQGYALYWGTSEWSCEEIQDAYTLASKMHCIAPSMEQVEYNLFQRKRVEEEYQCLYQTFGMGLTTWSPLACGILTNKYYEGFPEDSRLNKEKRLISDDFEQRIVKANKISLLAEKIGCTSAQLSLAWCLKNNNVSSVIMGVSSKSQLLENLASISIFKQLTSSLCQELDDLLITI